jgi:hypothetical protein
MRLRRSAAVRMRVVVILGLMATMVLAPGSAADSGHPFETGRG